MSRKEQGSPPDTLGSRREGLSRGQRCQDQEQGEDHGGKLRSRFSEIGLRTIPITSVVRAEVP